jgi:hypothetical protein
MAILLVSCMFGFSLWDGIPARDVREHKEVKEETKPAGRPAEMAWRLTTQAGKLSYGPPKAVLGFWSARLAGWRSTCCVGAANRRNCRPLEPSGEIVG